MPTATYPWVPELWQDLQPTPGRMSKALRIVLVSVFTAIIIMTFRLPFPTLGLYYIFVANRATPALSLRSSLYVLASAVTAVGVELGCIAISGNDPLVRLLSMVLVTFVCGIFIHESSIPTLGSTTGFLYAILIAQWEFQTAPNNIVEDSLWIIVTLSVGLSASVLVEFIFASKDPSRLLEAERKTRYVELERMFLFCANGATKEELTASINRVGQLAAAGQVEMQRLYGAIMNHGVITTVLPPGMQVRIAMLTRLVDLSAAFGAEYLAEGDPDVRERCRRISSICNELQLDGGARDEYVLDFVPGEDHTYLTRVEIALEEILRMPSGLSGSTHPDLVFIPAIHIPILTHDAFSKAAALEFALKLSCCATFCYVFYHAVGWPGISTCVVTVMITGLIDTGATKQRLSLRLAGMVIGGLILGLGSVVFLLPHMDSITALVVLVAAVSFIAGWFNGGRRFSFLGLQIAYSFYTVALRDYRATTDLAPARDNLVGLALAAVVMWVVFDQISSTPTIVVMRRQLATTLRDTAALLRLMNSPSDQVTKLIRGRILRYEVGKVLDGIRSASDNTEYEFGMDLVGSTEQANRILSIAFDVASLFWEHLAILYGPFDQEELVNPAFSQLRREMADELILLASRLEHVEINSANEQVTELASGRHRQSAESQYARGTISRYQKVRIEVIELIPQRLRMPAGTAINQS